MTSMRHVTTMSTTNHDNNLDALLEELQTSVSRPGSSLGHTNGPMTGYREVTRTVTTETDGHPTAKTSEYQIEYLNPSNTTTVLKEVPHTDLTLLNNVPSSNHGGYNKKIQYEYRTTTSGSSVPDAALPVADTRMRQNITELDSLLDDLHTAQRTGFADSSVARLTSGIDPGLLEPIDSSTPKTSLVSHSVEEHRYGSVGGRTSPARDVRRELVFTGGSRQRDQNSPTLPTTSVPVARQEIYRYETKTTRSTSGNRDLSPPRDRRQPSPSPARQQLQSVRTYNYSSSDDVPRTPTMHRSPSPAGVRSSSSTTVRQQQYNRDFSPEGSRQPMRSNSPSPKNPRTTSSKVTSVNNYSYNSTSRDTRSHEVPRSPPPHRSPSPVSFNAPPIPSHKSTSVKSYYEQSNNAPPYVRPQSPQPVQKFSPSDPSRTLTYQVSPPPSFPPQPTVITYKYSSQTTHSTKYPGEMSPPRYPAEENAPLLPRPFPTPSPTPETQQQPPKKLDDLMASFGETEYQHHHETSSRYVPVKEPMVQKAEAPPPAAPQPPPTPPPSGPNHNSAAMQAKSKNISGPPVYYPPGVELFSKKEEAMTQYQSGGGKYKAKAKYEYESSSKMKTKESSGKTVVPVCLPVCCAMPCVIM
ncbi:serine/arginine repetitive matrix protein 1 [Macrosteles quadrilineatus]|uniref:serine/arginine repetitive matrix protein 1 n=1 Tax=Macrosteles quadrilineatus TaxID=74068 RepID=UPI0023E1687C|nr:serine/arginine repetitive matrix protein 1 [Macrosteles quadrilineatus]